MVKLQQIPRSRAQWVSFTSTLGCQIRQNPTGPRKSTFWWIPALPSASSRPVYWTVWESGGPGSGGCEVLGASLCEATGTVNLTYGGEVAGVTAVFGEDSDPTVMGVTALESLGFNVNPVAGGLDRVEMLI